MKIAYFSTQYPSVNHAFIRREIRELERRGHEVLRISIQPSAEPLPDGKDQAELLRTVQFSSFPLSTVLGRLITLAFGHPFRFLRASWVAFLRSNRGLLQGLVWLIQAVTLLPILRRWGAEHLHVHFGTEAASVARLLRRLGGPPYSITMHGPD